MGAGVLHLHHGTGPGEETHHLADLIQRATAIEAQVEHYTLHLLLHHAAQNLLYICRAVHIAIIQVYIERRQGKHTQAVSAVSILQVDDAAAGQLLRHGDFIAHDSHHLFLTGVSTLHAQFHRHPFLPANQIHHLVDAQEHHIRPIIITGV